MAYQLIRTHSKMKVATFLKGTFSSMSLMLVTYSLTENLHQPWTWRYILLLILLFLDCLVYAWKETIHLQNYHDIMEGGYDEFNTTPKPTEVKRWTTYP